MPEPTPEKHLEFIANLQRILDEGQFFATYKYALLMALADLSIERGDDTMASLEFTARDIAEKFISYYWRQALPFPGGPVLMATMDPVHQAAVITRIAEAKEEHGSTLAEFKTSPHRWSTLVTEVARIVVAQPLWKLQTVGGERLSLFYENTGGGGRICLMPGVAASFRKFYGLVRNIVQAEWMRQVRAIPRNRAVLKENSELMEFLFGSDRAPLTEYREILRPYQEYPCFYCGRGDDEKIVVDHFIPWSRYPVDLAHNFVLAHASCNSRKSDHLPALRHLDAWCSRNGTYAAALASAFNAKLLLHDAEASMQVAEWAYGQARSMSAYTWIKAREFEQLLPHQHIAVRW